MRGVWRSSVDLGDDLLITYESEHHVESGLLLSVVVSERSAICELASIACGALMHWWDS